MAGKKFDLESYIKTEQKEEPKIEYKPDQFVVMPEVVQSALGMPGFALGHSTMLYGLSDSGKTSMILNIALAAQQQGILPILIVTENKLSMDRIVKAGIDPKKCIIREDLKHLEPIYDFISMKVQDILDGKLPMDVVFLWDSVAGAPSIESVDISKEGKITKNYTNQKNANVIGFYNPVIASRIAETRKKGEHNTAGLVMLTQAYKQPPEFPGAPTTLVPNGGEKIWFPLSMGIEMKEGQRLKAQYKGKNIEYGVISRIKVKKNHINGVNCEGEMAIISDTILPNDKAIINKFKEDNAIKWQETLDRLVNKEQK